MTIYVVIRGGEPIAAFTTEDAANAWASQQGSPIAWHLIKLTLYSDEKA